MIYVEMYGRLGNQFFRYAAARALQISQFPQEQLVLNFQQVNNAHKKDPSFYNVFPDFCVTNYQIWNGTGKVIFKKSDLKQKIICVPYYMGLKKIEPQWMDKEVAYEDKWSYILRKNGIYWFRRGWYPFIDSKAKNKFISGNFEDPRYFNNIRHVLLDEFSTNHKEIVKNKELYNKIKETNSVCISIRRGDFETNSNYKALHSVCHKDYFDKAIEVIKEKISKPTFFLFSDDINWAKSNIQTGCDTYFEDGTDPVWEKLRMMSMCKHFIISNSTFSWWSQWMSTNEGKIVVSPNRWFNNDYKSPLIDSSWIHIEV